MKSTLEQLSAKEREALAHFYTTDAHKAQEKLINLERLELAKDHVGKRDILDVCYLSGQSDGLKKLILTIRENYKTFDKKG